MKFYLRLPDGGEIKFEMNQMGCALSMSGLFVILAWVTASQCGFWALLWLFVLASSLLVIWRMGKAIKSST